MFRPAARRPAREAPSDHPTRTDGTQQQTKKAATKAARWAANPHYLPHKRERRQRQGQALRAASGRPLTPAPSVSLTSPRRPTTMPINTPHEQPQRPLTNPHPYEPGSTDPGVAPPPDDASPESIALAPRGHPTDARSIASGSVTDAGCSARYRRSRLRAFSRGRLFGGHSARAQCGGEDEAHCDLPPGCQRGASTLRGASMCLCPTRVGSVSFAGYGNDEHFGKPQ